MLTGVLHVLVAYATTASYFSICQEDDEVSRTVEAIRLLERINVVEDYSEVARRIGYFTEPAEIKIHSNEELLKKLKQLNEDYPELTSVYEIGKSVEGRPLTVLAIGRFPNTHSPGIPEFKYVANIHGNEISGRETLICLAEVLLINYGKNRVLTRLVDTTRIHLLPSMNPDGFERSIEGHDDVAWIQGRLNAAAKELNRDFPERLIPNDNHILQPETQAVINWTKSLPFVLSAGLHDGTALVNFPYDDDAENNIDESPTPDNDLFVYLSYSYARAHTSMWRRGPRCTGREDYIDEGITNGNAWYPVTGGMQDWNYVHADCFEVTIEMNCVKYSSKQLMKKVWEDHKFSLISFIEKVHRTIHGFVLDSATGNGIPGVRISINDVKKVITSSRDGDYWRLILPGIYNVKFEHAHYATAKRKIKITRERPFAHLNVTMERTAAVPKYECICDSIFRRIVHPKITYCNSTVTPTQQNQQSITIRFRKIPTL